MPSASSLPSGGQGAIASALTDQFSDLGALSKLDGADLANAFKAWLSGEGLSQERRQFRVKVGADNSALDGALHGRAMDITEAINADVCVHIKLMCLSTRVDLRAGHFIGQPISVEVITDRGGLHRINAIVTQAVQGPSDGGLQMWFIEARDALAIMDEGFNERVLINGSVLDVLQTYLSMWRQQSPALAQAFDFDLSGLQIEDHPSREFCMQTGESDTRYILRLARKAGINWVVVPGRKQPDQSSPQHGPEAARDIGHTVRFFVGSANLPRNAAGTVAYKFDGAAQTRDAITDWSEAHRLVPGKVIRQTTDYKAHGVHSTALDASLDQGEQARALSAGLVDHQIDPPHWGDSQQDHERLSTLRMRRHEMRASTVRGASGVRDFAAGTWVEVTDQPNSHLLDASDRQYLLTQVRHFAENNYGKDLDARIDSLFNRFGWPNWSKDRPVIGVHSAARRYGNTFEAVRRASPLVPEFDQALHWPKAHKRIAYVVGPEGEEVHLDELGRPQVSFPGVQVLDLARNQSQGGMLQAGQQAPLHPVIRTSAPVRMASPHASAAFGFIAPPRIGDEVLIDFLSGSPDRPVIQGSVYSPGNRPPTFGQKAGLPGNRFLTGLKLKEVGSERASDLCLDATSGQTGVRLYSDHAHTRISAGYITDEREDGKAQPLGEGVYACTDAAATLRAARGILQSAWPRLMAGGKQLDCMEAIALMEASLNLLKGMGDYSAQHQGLAVDTASQAELKGLVQNWQAGTNTDPQGAQQDTGLIAQTAPQGIASSTPKSIVHFAGENLDTVAQCHIQQAAGQHYSVNAGQGISHFAHAGGIRQIAHQGNHLTQSQHGDIVMESAQAITSRAVGEAIHMAKTHTFIAEDGSFIKIGDGSVSLGSKGPIQFMGASFPHTGPQTMAGTKPQFSKGEPDGQFMLRFGDPFHAQSMIAPNTPYEVDLSDGSTLQGVSDEAGRTSLKQRDAMHIAAVRIGKG
ncbi:type VI secretion system Vgr family protein [Aquabacterium sp.]|uniref:type VI secretion system Vgr family protein n=1 Tax=Aquabacterium sp. TaxID=1872578 RepID=UPI0035AE9532